MGKTTNIEWCDHSWSPWRGCAPVSPGCAKCYAAALAERFGWTKYRKGEPRILTKNWDIPKRLNKLSGHAMEAGLAMKPKTIFPSLCDPFDLEVPVEWHIQFWDLVLNTPDLTWLILTKRIENCDQEIDEAVHGLTRSWPIRNVWLGVSVENQHYAETRLNRLQQIEATKHFVSYEPALGPVDFAPWLPKPCAVSPSIPCGDCYPCVHNAGERVLGRYPIDWLICGGESGPGFRPCQAEWFESAAAQCSRAGVPVLIKQDSGLKPGQQGRISDELWKLKQIP